MSSFGQVISDEGFNPLSEPLPPGWAMQRAANGRIFFIDHNSRGTTWVSIVHVQCNPGLTICQGSSKIISLNREYRCTRVLPHTFYCSFC